MIATVILFIFIHSISSVSTITSQDVMALLLKYGYLQIENKDQLKNVTYQRELIEDGRFSDAVVKFQAFHNLNITSHLNDEVIKLLTSPRCGNPDIETHNSNLYYKSVGNNNYWIELIGKLKWPNRNITWRINNYSKNNMNQTEVYYTISKAFRIWSEVANINFFEVTDPNITDVNIEIRFKNIQQKSSDIILLAYGKYPPHIYRKEERGDGDVTFNSNIDWKWEGEIGGYRLLDTAVHEIGHSLGLFHRPELDSIMYSDYDRKFIFRKLQPSDIAEIQKLYGPPISGKVLPPLPTNPRESTGSNFPIYKYHYRLPMESQIKNQEKYLPIASTTIATIENIRKTGYNYCNTRIDSIYQFPHRYVCIFFGHIVWCVQEKELKDGSYSFNFFWGSEPMNVHQLFGFRFKNFVIDAICEFELFVILFSGNKFWVTNPTTRALLEDVPREGFPITKLGLPAYLSKVDAIFYLPQQKSSYIFAGNLYWEFDSNIFKYGYTLPNYPRLISSYWHGVPDYIDGVFITPQGNPYFIKDKYYFKFNMDIMNIEPEGSELPLRVPWFGCFEKSNKLHSY